MAGLMGAGRTQLCEMLFGIRSAPPGAIYVDGRPLGIRSPHDAVRAGIALITEDRQRTGLALRLPLRVNVTLANLTALAR
jgi:ABC-type sugar transport system ATPase subunit